MKKNKGPQYANGRSMVPQPRPSRTAPSSSPMPTPRPAQAEGISALQRANRIADRMAREEKAARRR